MMKNGPEQISASEVRREGERRKGGREERGEREREEREGRRMGREGGKS